MIFRTAEKEYKGATATEVVSQMARDAEDFTAKSDFSLSEFLQWSLKKLSDRLPPRELELSPRLSDELLAQSYLSLRHDFNLGELVE